jgi:hypothetical protein
MYHFYVSCGLVIQSEVELPELFPIAHFDKPDIRIQLDEIEQDSLTDPSVTKPFSQFNKDQYYFEFPDVVRLLVRNGCEITVEFLSSDTRFARQFIYDNALPVAMMQRNKVLFRASGVVDENDQVWLFFAEPRSGKTSTALKMTERGYRFFSDGIVGLASGPDDTVVATPFGPAVHLWPPVEAVQTVFETADLHLVREDISKKVGVLDADRWSPEPRTVTGLIEVERITNSLSHRPISMVEAFEVLRNGVYFNHNTVYMDMEPGMFAMLTQLVKQTRLIRVTRPKMTESYAEVAEYVDLKIIRGGVHV